MRSGKGLQRLLWIATRAVFNTSVSRQTIPNLACSVIHPTPNRQKLIIILFTAMSFSVLLVYTSREKKQPKRKTNLIHWTFDSVRPVLGNKNTLPPLPLPRTLHKSTIQCCRFFLSHLFDLHHLTHFLPPDWFLARRIRGFNLKWLNSAHYAKSIFFTQIDAARRSKGWWYKYALLCDCEPSPYLTS